MSCVPSPPLGRTFVFGDIHGESEELQRVLAQLPPLGTCDTLVFLGDYVDRGPASQEVVASLMALPATTPARVVCLRGNHEDAWVRVRREGWDEFSLPPEHGCLATLRSYRGGAMPVAGEQPGDEEMALMASGDFLPAEVVAWMASLPLWHEDEHALYVHAGLQRGPIGFLHPSRTVPPEMVAWVRTDEFTRTYAGKRVLFGHTPVRLLPPELSTYTPADPTDMWESEHAIGLDTGCGAGGFLTAIELPSMRVYESRSASARIVGP